MKKLFLLVGLVVFLTPMAVNADESELLDSRCIESIQLDLIVGDQIGENDGEWLNVTKQCEPGGYIALKEIMSSSLFINNNKTNYKLMIARKVHSLTTKKCHDCTNS